MSVVAPCPVPFSTLLRPRSAARLLHPSASAGLDVVAPDVLEAVAADLALTVSPDFENPVADARRHRQLVRTASYDAWLIGWGPSSLLELHDHGGSVGAIRVIQGELIETYSDKLHRHPLRSLSVGAGGRHFVPATRIHEVWNPGPSPALSVHVYSPPLTAMTFFDRSLSPLRTEYGNAASLD